MQFWKENLPRNLPPKAWWHQWGPLALAPKAKIISGDRAFHKSIKPFFMHRDVEGKTMDRGSICEAADVFAAQTQSHRLDSYLWAHTFVTLQKW